jgi:hypothetical protein
LKHEPEERQKEHGPHDGREKGRGPLMMCSTLKIGLKKERRIRALGGGVADVEKGKEEDGVAICWSFSPT